MDLGLRVSVVLNADFTLQFMYDFLKIQLYPIIFQCCNKFAINFQNSLKIIFVSRQLGFLFLIKVNRYLRTDHSSGMVTDIGDEARWCKEYTPDARVPRLAEMLQGVRNQIKDEIYDCVGTVSHLTISQHIQDKIIEILNSSQAPIYVTAVTIQGEEDFYIQSQQISNLKR